MDERHFICMKRTNSIFETLNRDATSTPYRTAKPDRQTALLVQLALFWWFICWYVWLCVEQKSDCKTKINIFPQKWTHTIFCQFFLFSEVILIM